MKKTVNVSQDGVNQVISLNKLLQNSKFSKSLDGIILELQENAVVKRIWVKDNERRFLPSEFFKNEELKDFATIFGDAFSETIGKVIQTGEKQECIYADFDSLSQNWYRAKFRKVYSGTDEASIICEIEDITNEKLLGEQLVRSTAEIERINNLLDIGMDISQMGGWEYDLKTREILVTRQISNIICIDHHLIHRYHEMTHCFSSSGRHLLLRTLHKCFKECCPFDLEFELNCGAVVKWVRIAGITVSDRHGVRFFRGILKDISSSKRQRLELIEAKNMAEQVARKRTEILSIMSHEIRTPLNGIIGISSLLNQMAFENQDTLELIQHLSFSSNHLLHLVNDILDMEKINSKKIELNNVETNLMMLVEQIKSQFLLMAEAKKLKLTVSFSHDIPKLVLVDELRLSRVLNNLVSNAIKFTETGSVSLSLETVVKKPESVKIRFRITDTGIGIPDHFHNLVFDKFHQVQQASHRKQQGTGLGLSITKGLLKLFKSEIVLSSKLGQGTTFEFEIGFKLPNDTKITDVEKLNHKMLPRLAPFHLLIVDDNEINLFVTKTQIKAFGIDADLAQNGFVALDMLKIKQYDVILIDLHMPEMDGYALAREVEQIYPQIKRIIFTADIVEEVRNRLKEMGIYHILSKPFDPKEMHRVLSEVLAERT